MSGRKIENANYLDNDWQDEIESKNLVKKGFYNLDFDLDLNIKAESSVDVSGVLYVFDVLEAPTGIASTSGFGYIKLIGGATSTASFTTEVPIYNYNKKGWYNTAGERFILRFEDEFARQIYLKDENSISQHEQEIIITSILVSEWTIRTTPNLAFRSVTYGNGLFVAVAASGTGNRAMTSPDGITWTSRTTPESNNWSSVTYGNGLFVAVTTSGTDRVMTSPDGITWTSRTTPVVNGWNDITYGNGLFVAVASSGTDRVMTSPDGITWTDQTASEDLLWIGITYGNGLFVAVASSGTGDRVMTSPDGINWLTRTNPVDNSWIGITYGNGLFVAVAGSGTGDRIMTSTDGIKWLTRTNPVDNSWVGITFGNNIFVAVSSTGSSNQAMTSVII